MKLPFLLVVFIAGKAVAQQPAGRIDSFMTALYGRGQFTGSILIADHGEVVYEKAFGFADREKKLPFTTGTQEYIGSISKQFTAMGIMILKDRGKLDYGQSVRVYFPQLPAFMQPVTIRNLLYHTSGLAIFNDYPDMTEKDVFDILLRQDKLGFTPGSTFQYCNAGYSLLGMIIEKISGESLDAFLKVNVFKPLGMDHTVVDEISHRDTERAVGYDAFGEVNSYSTFMGGNASIISTVDDMYKWDRALYHFPLVKPQTLAEAYTPSDQVTHNPVLLLKDGTFGDKSYGFGVWIAMHDGAKDFFHDGAFSGYQAYNERMMDSRLSIIEISNLRHAPVYEIRDAILEILAGRPYRLPKMDGTVWLNRKIAAAGIDSAISGYRALRLEDTADYDFSEGNLNSFAYVLLRAGRVVEAIKVFRLNADWHPGSFNVWDSLADGFEKAGEKAKALESCKKALALDPSNEYEKNRVKTLETNP